MNQMNKNMMNPMMNMNLNMNMMNMNPHIPNINP